MQLDLFAQETNWPVEIIKEFCDSYNRNENKEYLKNETDLPDWYVEKHFDDLHYAGSSVTVKIHCYEDGTLKVWDTEVDM